MFVVCAASGRTVFRRETRVRQVGCILVTHYFWEQIPDPEKG